MTTDILMITHRRPEYLRLSLPRLLETCAPSGARVWLWHNGEDAETLEVVRNLTDHEAVACFHHSPENVGIQAPTNWLWQRSKADFVSKVDDDCLLEDGWIEALAETHGYEPRLGVVGCWRFLPEDFMPEVAQRKIRDIGGGHQLLENLWTQGSGYLLKRQLVEKHGQLKAGQSFPQYCKMLALRGCINGWHYPFLREEHMDDPRSPHTLLTSDAELQRYLPLSALRTGVRTLDDWTEQLRRSAVVAQTASVNPQQYSLAGKAKRKLAQKLARRGPRGAIG